MNRDTAKKLIQQGTVIIARLNDYRRGECYFKDIYDLGFTTYWRWKRQVFDHLYENGIEEIKLDFLWEDDILKRDYLKLCKEVENQKTKNRVLDEITQDVKRLNKELLKLEPFGDRLKIIISETRGIYRSDNEKQCYGLYGELRKKIISALKEETLDEKGINARVRHEGASRRDDKKNIGKAINKINELFRQEVCDEYDLINKLKTKKYELNKDKLEIIFTE